MSSSEFRMQYMKVRFYIHDLPDFTYRVGRLYEETYPGERRKNSFFIVRGESEGKRWTHSVFFCGGCVNSTGIRSEDDVEWAIMNICCTHLGYSRNEVALKILPYWSCDCYSFRGLLCNGLVNRSWNRLNLHAFTDFVVDTRHLLKICRDWTVKAIYLPDSFPALRLRSSHGTVILRASGNYVIVGGKQRHEIFALNQMLHSLLLSFRHHERRMLARE